ncbi:hypothetical protein WR25_17204 [Diploscapter pachys]|uniref:Uncharacterized protein n=1 Tax=Diploscapter pachys TaxID=2018661 RepID=A0A2A2JVL2_9BILA|nr:hypothetical protein WR25_17204 [Diploscapter pachys]
MTSPLSVFLLASLLPVAFTSFCGNSAIPFSFEVLPDGQPVLGCARPSCFGWNPQGNPATNNANFYRVNQRPDGFMRKDRNSIASWNTNDPRRYKEFTAVSKNERQFAFDYISDLEKVINADGSVSYNVKIRRLPCLPVSEGTANTDYEDSEAAILKFNQGSSSSNTNQYNSKPAVTPVASGGKLVPLEGTNQFSNSISEQIHESQENGLEGPFEELIPQVGTYNVGPPPPQVSQYAQPPSYAAPPQPNYAVAPQPAQPYYPVSSYGGASSGCCGGASGYFCFAKDTEAMRKFLN